MKATLTGKQAKKILEIFEDTPVEQVQAILASGLLTDLRDANFSKEIDRSEVQRLLGLNLAFVYDKTKDGWTLISDVGFQLGEVELVEFLKPGENSVGGNVMADRAKELGANLGQKNAEWLEQNQDRIPAKFRQFYLVFPGTVWQGPYGDRCVPYLCWVGGRWRLSLGRLKRGWRSSDRLLRLRHRTSA